MRFCFVGEAKSKLAIKMNVSWIDGRLAGKQLFDALIACGINPQEQSFFNASTNNVKTIRALHDSGYIIVGMGRIAHERLDRWAIPHTLIVHPAARGLIRRKENYNNHIRERLTK